MTEEELRMKAFSLAICDALASVAADTVILRQILNARGVVLDDEFEEAMKTFRQSDKWEEYKKQISELILRDVKRQLAELRGPVN